MKPFHRNTLFVAFASFAALALAACGGGGGGTASTTPTASNPPTALASITGVAADGYLLNAKACLDLNDNSTCDAGEPSADTLADGSFTIPNVKPADKNKHSVIVIVNKATVDSDTSKAVGSSYTLTAPPGKPGFISPVTTMINSQMQKNGSSAADAEKVVKQNMGFAQNSTIDLFQDYVKSSKNTKNPQKDDFAKIHKIAQITAKILGDNQTKIVSAAATAGVDSTKFMTQIVNLVVQQVLSQLNKIEKIALSKTPTVLTGINTSVGITKIKKDLEKEKATHTSESLSSINIEALLVSNGGITGFQANKDCSGSAPSCLYHFYSDNIQLQKSSATPPIMTMNETQSQYSKTAKAWNTINRTENVLLLTSTGFTLNDSGKSTLTIDSATQSATEKLVGGLQKIHRFIKVVKLGGQPISYFLGELGDDHQNIGAVNLKTAGTTFSNGARAYKFATTIGSTDIYSSDLDNEQQKCWNPAIAYANSSTNCNSVTVQKTGTTGSSITATTLSGLLTTSTTQLNEVQLNKVILVLHQTGTATTGTVDVYNNPQSSATTSATTLGTPIATTTWVRKTVNTADMIIVKVANDDLRENLSFGQPDPFDAIFFTQIGSYVRFGTRLSAGTFSLDQMFMFNKIAASDITTNFKVVKDQ